MKQLNVKIPKPVETKLEKAADKHGISKSEQVRLDLINTYYRE